MLRDQCKAYCRCSYCVNQKGHTGAHPNITNNNNNYHHHPNINTKGISKDEMYLRTLNETLRGRSLMASARSAHKFRPDEMLQSTRGDMARAAVTVPLRRRDRLQALLLLENKERLRRERELRRERHASGIWSDDETQDRAVGTRDDVKEFENTQEREEEEEEKKKRGLVMPTACSAEEDLRAALQTIQNITEENNAGDANKPLTSEHIYKLRQLVHSQDEKTKKMLAECPQQPHVCNHCFAVNVQGKHHCQIPPPHILQESTLPSIHNRSSTRRLKYNPHPYGSGVVWLPIDEQDNDRKATRKEIKGDSPISDDKEENDYQYPGSTHNIYPYNPQTVKDNTLERERLPTNGDRAAFMDSGNNNKNENAVNGNNNNNNNAATATRSGKSKKEPLPYKSTAALWRTTNQDQAAQMKRFLEFKKLQNDASRVYAESAIKRRGNNTTDDAAAATAAANY